MDSTSETKEPILAPGVDTRAHAEPTQQAVNTHVKELTLAEHMDKNHDSVPQFEQPAVTNDPDHMVEEPGSLIDLPGQVFDKGNEFIKDLAGNGTEVYTSSKGFLDAKQDLIQSQANRAAQLHTGNNQLDEAA
jgi:hypothetical protein